MRWLVMLLLVVGCSKKKADARVEPAKEVEKAPAATPVVPEKRAPEPPPATAKAKLQITLRSTPSGAEAQVDGKPVGQTPVTVPVEDDGQPHEFVFLLPGYAMERYRTSPLKDGVIHARMRAVPVDAGP